MAVQIVGGTVQRVDNPFVFCAFVAQHTCFFGQDAVLRVGFLQCADNNVFGLPVHIGDKVVGGFAVHADGRKVVRCAQHQVACFACGFECGVEGRVELL